MDTKLHRSVRFLKSTQQGALILALLVVTSCSGRQSSASLLLGGDVILARSGTPVFDVSAATQSPWEDVARISTVNTTDVFAVNLESPFGVMPPGLPVEQAEMNLCAPSDTAEIIQLMGIDLATTANNHSADCAQDDRLNTEAVLSAAGIVTLPHPGATEVDTPTGEKIFFVAINDYSGTYELESLKKQIQASRQQSDLVVVSIHWGMEYQGGPSKREEKLARELVEAGADVIWGHHPHVLRRMEWMTSSMDGHRALVLYSLGNLLTDQFMLDDTSQTALVRLDFHDHRIDKVTVFPLVMSQKELKVALVKNADIMNMITDRLNLEEMKESGVEIVLWSPVIK